jgi:hypothetical protein
MPQADWKKAATYGLETEKAAFTSLPDRVSGHPFPFCGQISGQ